MMASCKWQEIQTAPRDGTAVLLFRAEWDMLQVGVQYEGTGIWQNSCGDVLREPTHWMMLPAPPRKPGALYTPSEGQGRTLARH